jgi:hypothetical protein
MKVSNIKLYGNLSSGRRFDIRGRTDRQTDRQTEAWMDGRDEGNWLSSRLGERA